MKSIKVHQYKAHFVLGLVITLYYISHAFQNTLTSIETERKIDSEINSARKLSRLGDGCLFVYLDVGANIGVHTRFLFEPEKYPEAATAIGLFDNVFGKNRSNLDICSFGFEPNPAHKRRHMQLQQSYQQMGWRYTYINAGASDHNGTLTFWHRASAQDQSHEEWGFSTAKLSENDIPERAPLVHLAKWIQTHIVERQLPETTFGQYTEEQLRGKVVMKLDIEGSEYSVLPSLLFSGVICNGVDVVFGEDHPRLASLYSRPAMDNATGKGEIDLDTYDKAIDYLDDLIHVAFKSVHPQSCKGTWLELDDESYLHDGVPFPSPVVGFSKHLLLA